MLDGTTVDRAGGSLRLETLAAELLGRAYTVRIIDAGTLWRLVVDHFPETVPAGDRYTKVSPVEVELRVVEKAASAAVRDDQRAELEEDRRELSWSVLPKLVALARDAADPETVKRARGGDR